MPKILAALLLSLAAMVVHAQDRTQVFSATTSGDLLIDADGRVAELDLHRKQLGDEVMAAIELRIREWRFQPVQVDGRPTPIRVRLQLDMLALREPGATGVTLAIRGVRFFDERIPVAVSGAGAGSPMRTPPVYPGALASLGIGGSVWLVVRVDADGHVVEAAGQAVELRTERADSSAKQQKQARLLVRASERAARDWILPAQAGKVVLVPVKFRIGNDTGERWMRIHNVPLEVPAWVTAERDALVRLDDGGEPTSSRVQLLSPLS